MLDLKFVRNNPEVVAKALQKRRTNISLDEFLVFEAKRRELLGQAENLKNKRNVVSEEIGLLKKSGQPAQEQQLEMRQVSDTIKKLDDQLRTIEAQIEDTLLTIPNIPDESVPEGLEDADNIELKRWGEPKVFDFAAKPHWDLGEQLDILDFKRGGKVTGTRFTFYKGAGAALERAVFNFMLDVHTNEHGYVEVLPPYIVNANSLIGTGQLPKFAEDMFKLEKLDYYLIPTAEVPVTNLYNNEVLDGAILPIKHCAFSACFRSEAGAAGRDTRGLIRQHQFNKVELVKFVRPEDSFTALEQLTQNAEKILQLLELPYRVVLLCAGDLGFSSAKTYDLEVWLPSYNEYKEISSCSNFLDFQARRANIRFKDGKDKPRFVHTLNGSGLAVGRTVAAIMENYQTPQGTIAVPQVLQPYMGGRVEIG